VVDKSKQGEDDWSFPSPKGMQGWLQREIVDIKRAADLRIKDAMEFVNAYARGEISSPEAEERSYAYSQRWGDVIPGVMRTQGMTDEEIVKALDETRVKQRHIGKHIAGGKTAGKNEPSR
jgi:hypothetical protein